MLELVELEVELEVLEEELEVLEEVDEEVDEEVLELVDEDVEELELEVELEVEELELVEVGMNSTIAAAAKTDPAPAYIFTPKAFFKISYVQPPAGGIK